MVTTVRLIPYLAPQHSALRKQPGHVCFLRELDATSDVQCVWLSEPEVVYGTLMCGTLLTLLVKLYDIIACHCCVKADVCK